MKLLMRGNNLTCSLIFVIALNIFPVGNAQAGIVTTCSYLYYAVLYRLSSSAFDRSVVEMIKNGDKSGIERIFSFLALEPSSRQNWLHFATSQKQWEIVKTLLATNKCGMSLDGEGHSPLDLALELNAPAEIRDLMRLSKIWRSNKKLREYGMTRLDQMSADAANSQANRIISELKNAAKKAREGNLLEAYDALSNPELMKGTGYALIFIQLDTSDFESDFQTTRQLAKGLLSYSFAENVDVLGKDLEFLNSVRRTIPMTVSFRIVPVDLLPDFATAVVRLPSVTASRKFLFADNAIRDFQVALLCAYIEEIGHAAQNLRELKKTNVGFISDFLRNRTAQQLQALSKTINALPRDGWMKIDHWAELDIYAFLIENLGSEFVPDWFKSQYAVREFYQP